MRRAVIAVSAALAACGREATDAPEPVVPVVEESAVGWEARLTEMLPYIDACIARTPETRWVSFAAPTGEALVTVRLLGDGGGFDCTVPDDDPTPTHAVITHRRESWEVEGEGSAIFVRGPGENPGGECYEAPEVRDATGALLGWMADPEGC